MQTPLAIAASVLAVLIWLISRRRPAVPSVSAASSARPAPVAQVLDSARESLQASSASVPTPGQSVVLNRHQRLRSYKAAMVAGPLQRLAVMEQLHHEPDRASLPLLRIGLRDADPAVVRAAARAIETYRGRTAVPAAQSVVRRLPRNAAPRA